MTAMQKSDGIGDAGNKTAHSETKAPDVDAAGSGFGEVLAEAIRIVKRSRELLRGTLSPTWRR